MKKISCKENEPGKLFFYIQYDKSEYYLFNQSFRPAIEKRFQNGEYIDDAIKASRCREHPSYDKIRTKVLRSLRYLDKEYGLTLLDHRKRRASSKNRCRREKYVPSFDEEEIMSYDPEYQALERVEEGVYR